MSDLYEDWINGELRFSAVFESPVSEKWWESCPTHGSTIHTTRDEAINALHDHLRSDIHRKAT